MNKPTKLFGALTIIMLFFMTSCASTKVVGEWKDPNLTSKKFKKIMVIGVAKQPDDRRAYEEEFVRQLNAKGVTAIASHKYIPRDKMRDRETITKNIEGLGIDGVIITRLKEVKDKKQFFGEKDTVPYDNYNNMYEYYNSSFVIAPSSRTRNPTNYQKFGFESNLYDTETEKLVFSLASNTYAQDNIHKRLGSYIKTVVNKLSQNNLL
jgi:hypothetical protein